MSKKYIPHQMISQSRFIDLYNEWNEEYRALLIDRMNTLIQENSQYTADAMYKFLEPQVKSMKKLASHGWFVPMLKLTMPLMFKKSLGYA